MEAVKQSLPVKDIVNVFFAREFAYDILRRFFIEEPSKEYVKEFIQRNMIDQFPFQDESDGILDGVQVMKKYLSQHDPIHIDNHFEDLHWDYTRMFIGPFEILAQPWESVYVRKDKLLFQKTTMDVRKVYEKYGFQTADFNIEPDDHVGLELDFVYRLNQLCIQAGQSERPDASKEINYLLKEQQRFINDHLLAFIPMLAERVATHAETDFFRGLAKILEHFLQMDSKVLQELLNIEIIQDK
ncbi:molecular chaperone TorD family protein [Neobacillus drentensis]|uniref:TorD/DmsD family molecular chaperone n=1 Tax=Neobacillus drentensis TaxID=220684 RepID=UPI002FFE260E